MLEYLIIADKAPISNKLKNRAVQQFQKNSILREQEAPEVLSLEGGKVLFIFHSDFNYQGPPVFHDGSQFTALVGYVLSEKLENTKDNIAAKLHQFLTPNRDNVAHLQEGLGGFQIIHLRDGILTIHCSKLMEHAVYYAQENSATFIANRNVFIASALAKPPPLDLNTQVNLIGYESIFRNYTAHQQILVLARNHYLKLSLHRLPPLLNIVRENNISLTSDVEFTQDFPAILEAAASVEEWLTRHMRLFSTQMALPDGISFNLSGGKDSRMVLALLAKAGLLKHFEEVKTFGHEGDAEVVAARQIAQYYGVPHKAIAGSRTYEVMTEKQIKSFFDHLPYQIFQAGGEFSAHVLQGSKVKQRPRFPGHEMMTDSLATAFLTTGCTYDDVRRFIQQRFPLDKPGILRPHSRHMLLQRIADEIEEAQSWGVSADSFLHWLKITNKGFRWQGKITAMGSLHGLYVNPLCAWPVAEFAHKIGPDSRTAIIFYLGMFAAINKDLLQYPFANQNWSAELRKQFSNRFMFPEAPITSPNVRVVKQPIYEHNDRQSIIRLFEAIRHPDLESEIDYTKLIDYIRRTPKPGAWARVTIFATISSSLMLHGKTVDVDGLKRMKAVSADLEKVFKEKPSYPVQTKPNKAGNALHYMKRVISRIR